MQLYEWSYRFYIQNLSTCDDSELNEIKTHDLLVTLFTGTRQLGAGRVVSLYCTYT